MCSVLSTNIGTIFISEQLHNSTKVSGDSAYEGALLDRRAAFGSGNTPGQFV